MDKPEPVYNAEEFQSVVDRAGGLSVSVFYERDGQRASVSVTPRQMGDPVWIGMGHGSNEVEAVRKGAWAESIGLKKGDVIARVGEREVRCRSQVYEALDADMTAVPLTLRRGDATLTLTAPARTEPAKDAVAFVPGQTVDSLMLSYPAARAGILPGDVIVSAGGKPVTGLGDLVSVMVKAEGQPVEIVWKRDGTEMRAQVRGQKRWVIGLPLLPAQKIVQAGPLRSIHLGARKALQWAVRIYATLRSLIVGEVSPRHLSGPLSIGYLAYAAASRGPGTFLYILGVLSVNLGVFNLLPIPVLDGGHLLFAGFEKVRGKPLSERIRNVATYVGLGFILALLVLAFWNDIQQFIFG